MNQLNINDFAKEVHENAKAHGWWEEPRSFGEIIALCHSELSEALEEYRERRPKVWRHCDLDEKIVCGEGEYYHTVHCCTSCGHRGEKPEGIAVELADCIIRILDYCGHEGIDIEEALRIKHEYNKGRPYRHGGKVI